MLSNIDSNSTCPSDTSMPSSPKKSQGTSLTNKPSTGRNVVESREQQEQHVYDLSHERTIQTLLQGRVGSVRSWEAKIIRDFFSGGNNAASTSCDSMAWGWLKYNGLTDRAMDKPIRTNAADLCPTLSNLVILVFVKLIAS